MIKRLLTLLMFSPLLGFGAQVAADSTYRVDAVSVTAIKQGLNIRQEPISSTILAEKMIAAAQIKTMKDASAIAPNFYIPDYGSRITSSIYVRGLGARIDQPVVGLNIDNIPYLNKNAFDTDVMDISRMEILRGPQSTLYGRNTMGGVINIYTLSPMNFEGVKVGAEYSSGNTYRVRAAIYERLSERLAASLSGYYGASDGLFENEYTGENCDTYEEFGARMRLIYNLSKRSSIDNTTSLSHLDQGGYAYRSLERDEISYNDICSYDRMMLSNGLTFQHRADRFTISSITGYQYLDDKMILDQDFSPESIFTLTQATREHSITEDIVLNREISEGFSYLVGLFGFYKNQNINAPVIFKEGGIEDIILTYVNGADDYYEWNSDEILLDSKLQYDTYGAAIYHKSNITLDKFDLSAAIRLDFEGAKLRYNCTTNTSCTHLFTDGRDAITKIIDIDIDGTPTLHFFEALPTLNATYRINNSNSIYATISKGYKAGGFNTQMFSDILQQELMEKFGLSGLYEAQDIISYDPEYSWNYEIGAHLTNRSSTIASDISLYYINCRDQQLTIFPDDAVTGRLMTNAGRSRIYGAEVAIRAQLGNLAMNGSYGYTDAKFVEYNDNEADYAGNYIPYAPRHTIYATAIYTIPLKKISVDIEVNTSGAGKIYWNESNTLSQPLYALLGSSVRFYNDKYSISIWGKNLTNKEYSTFYFDSMGEFMQMGRPTTYGMSLNWTI